jgi:hypothetical protein
MTFALDELSGGQLQKLEKWKPNDLRRMLVGYVDSSPVLIVDELGEALTAELECEYKLVVPTDSHIDGCGLVFEKSLSGGDLYRAGTAGLTRVQMKSRVIDIRVMPKKYIGRAQFRYMENTDD